MPVNVGPEYSHAEKKFLAAQTDDEKVLALEEPFTSIPSAAFGNFG